MQDHVDKSSGNFLFSPETIHWEKAHPLPLQSDEAYRREGVSQREEIFVQFFQDY